ncbi:DUF2235 domain-containing protein [Candidatus Accumulibacter sp. ACC003]|jgi:uncharacterized protein (DUF2235 family)|uniref:DUF2235 domain-containing protein n=1 Tax=Candidatus Accumulibacter sp. ACC003 TaxID=2823334 RepID=UPI0025C2B5EB|nr:DUF2235 domain-containing protein [Candidatus Accumulibacter sp. ACC003]
MAKNIVFCADGTWNNPDQDADADHTADPTNVYKLFLCLAGTLSSDSLRQADEQEKVLTGGAIEQVAKYIHGVGDSRNPIKKLMGGAFGAGIISRVVRGYTFISRNYEPGANIFITGFSRGAYTARALAGLIVSQGLLTRKLTEDKEQAYRLGAEAWYGYRKTTIKPSSLHGLAEIAADLPAFLSRDRLAPTDRVPVDRLAAVAVWDTVGALGIPTYAGGKHVDTFQFADTRLSEKVGHGFHAVSLDERRNDFTPTLWDQADNVTQVLFPGAHADVGGGYPVANHESGLSDGALQWMLDRLQATGVLLASAPAWPIAPNPAGTAHQPWQHRPWTLPGVSLGARSFPPGTPADPSIAARRGAGKVVAEPGEAARPYQPANLP